MPCSGNFKAKRPIPLNTPQIIPPLFSVPAPVSSSPYACLVPLRPLVGPLDFSSFELLKCISNLPPLIDEVQVHHTDCVILARKRATLTLHFLLSTVFDPANHLSQQRPLRYVPLLKRTHRPVLKFSSCALKKDAAGAWGASVFPWGLWSARCRQRRVWSGVLDIAGLVQGVLARWPAMR
jgi:hypothetical protein